LPRPDLRRQRGRRTRERLLAHALRLFGASGMKATTTLAIARAACANQSSIRYHFGGKRGLYLAVASRIASDGARAMEPLLARSRRRGGTRDDARELLSEMLQCFARQLCNSSDRGAAASFLARELGTPGPGYETIYDGYVRDVHVEATRLLARSTSRFPGAQSAIIDTHALIGAVLGFAAARSVLKQRTFRPVYSEERIDEICGRIADATARIAECKGATRAGLPRASSPSRPPRSTSPGPAPGRDLLSRAP